jgi:hypothetical protein
MRFIVRLSVFVTAILGCFSASQLVRAQTPIQAGQVIISELRLRGPAGAEDEFIEIYNTTTSPIVVQSTDASSGWTIVISNGQITGPVCTIPNGTQIPARGHLLCANSNGYSLSGYPGGNAQIINTVTVKSGESNIVVASPFAPTTPDRTFDFDIPDGSGIALFSTTNGTNFTAATRLDAFGFSGSPALFKEGSGWPTIPVSNNEHTFYRDMRTAGGLPRDTNDNVADFLLVATAPSIVTGLLGAPGPENLSSPVNHNTDSSLTLLDPLVAASQPPNREKRPNVEPNADLGTLLLRRTYTNNTGQPITRLRFRVMDITTLGVCPSPCADVRALTSQDGEAGVQGQVVTVRGLKLEEPPSQPLGGGFNASLSADFITFSTPLPAGQSVNVVFKLGIMRNGTFRYLVNFEALTTPTQIN